MPVLPVSEFWKCSFFKYYDQRWLQDDLCLTSGHIDGDGNSNLDHQNQKVPKWLVRSNIQVMVSATLLLVLVMCVIPLSTDLSCNPHPRTASTALFIVYESVYVCFGYPVVVQMWELAFPTQIAHRCVHNVFLPFTACVGVTVFCIVISPLTTAGDGQSHPVTHTMYRVRTLLCIICSAYVALVYIFAVLWKKCRIREKSVVQFVDESEQDIDCSYTLQVNDPNDLFSGQQSQHSVAGKVDHPLWQCLLVVINVCCITACYYWTQFLTHEWNDSSSVDIQKATSFWSELRHLLLLYPSFWFVLTVLRFITQRFARLVDANKTSLYSFEIVVVFFCSCFYFVFYRNLFLHVTTYTNFVVVKTMHVVCELCSYSLRMSKWYYAKTDALQKEMKERVTMQAKNCNVCCWLPKLVLFALYDESDFETWSIRLSIDLTLSFIVSLLSAFSYLLEMFWMRFGYNAYFYNLQYISNDQFIKTVVFTMISIAVELIVYVAIDKWLKYKHHIECIKYWRVLIHHRPYYLWYLIWTFAHVTHDALIAKIISVE